MKPMKIDSVNLISRTGRHVPVVVITFINEYDDLEPLGACVVSAHILETLSKIPTLERVKEISGEKIMEKMASLYLSRGNPDFISNKEVIEQVYELVSQVLPTTN